MRKRVAAGAALPRRTVMRLRLSQDPKGAINAVLVLSCGHRRRVTVDQTAAPGLRQGKVVGCPECQTSKLSEENCR